MNTIRLSDSELESAELILSVVLDDFDFSGDIKDHKMGMVASIMYKQIIKIQKELEK